MWDPIAYALGFIDCDNISARCMLTIFQLFAIRSEASVRAGRGIGDGNGNGRERRGSRRRRTVSGE
jgi:uncharacterized protein with NAD-binding domain and iron-sulfur cluster